MKRISSIAALLSAITVILVVLLVSVFAWSARNAFAERQKARASPRMSILPASFWPCAR